MGNRVELDEMGKRILDASRTELYLSMRFLGPALHSLGWIMDLSTAFVGTDAAMIRFNPNYLFQLYVNRPRFLNRTYLHMILHCVFRHMFTAREKEDRELWDLASDIAVDAIIDSMEYRAVAELTPEYRQKWYSRLEEEIHVLTAERIYQYFIERKRNYLEEMQLAQIFAYDDHSFWERMEDEEENPSGENSRQKDSDNSPSGNTDSKNDSENDSENDSGPGNDDPDSKKDSQTGNKENNKEENKEKNSERNARRQRPSGRQDEGGNKDSDRRNGDEKNDEKNGEKNTHEKSVRKLKKIENLNRQWKETSERMEAELLASGKEASQDRGSLDRILSISNRRRTDYREFLRKFAILREVTTIDPDSFDYGFYNYGLEVYGNMPLIEENEYREMNRIRTLAIAIDTSASCQEILVQRFLNETAAVLRNIGQFFSSSEVHIIECDEHVQDEIVVRDISDLEKYAESFHVKGGFGTDFRPVFSYIEEKRRTGEIRDMEALMYFTDGMGIYPEKPTDYDTAFVFFNDEELDDSKVPDWAMKLYIRGEKLVSSS
ncbi:Putative metallopeptidase domain-containing protein [Sarcina sp. DSM 11001]|uniref:vWA domain-containing protein n=1 Tax=Sarcina sp. DSM 11001 TaxID=1798184 RepID=UPI0008892E28|nr:VWA-like domain-containing protein [Sarcina sp. DSM 11001]SDK96313.1 Putative metallopeptidase domain-containing protein [Sarcina sp. DSM 11001]